MQILIDIPEKDYNNIEPFLNGEPIKGGFNLFKALEIIKNGTPLPKGHGRLIDADKLWDSYHDLDYDFYEAFDLVDTIIEADKESEDKG
jgi:hypothetical protein